MTESNGANLGFEATSGVPPTRCAPNMDAAEYKHVVLGLIFLKYISDAFEEQHAKLDAERATGADPEDPDEYRAENIFWVPPRARWSHLQANAKQPTIGKIVDDAMVAIERDNPTLKGVLPKDYARPRLDKQRLGELIDLIGTIGLGDRREPLQGHPRPRLRILPLRSSPAPKARRAASSTRPAASCRSLVEMLAPYKGRVFDPCCGSGGMFVQSEKFVEAHGGKIGDISIYGQESNPTTWRLAKMNLAIRGIEANLGPEHADSFHRDLHQDLKADYVLANPPFNDSDWGGDLLTRRRALEVRHPARGQRQLRLGAALHPSPRADRHRRFRAGQRHRCRPTSPAKARSARRSSRPTWSIAWSPCPGSSSTRRKFPSASGSSPADKKNGRFRDRRGETLFIDARKLGTLIDRVHRELTDDDIRTIADTYHAWRGDKDASRSTRTSPASANPQTLEDIRHHGHVLTPGRYVGAGGSRGRRRAIRGEDEARLTDELREQTKQSAKLDKLIWANLEDIGYGE